MLAAYPYNPKTVGIEFAIPATLRVQESAPGPVMMSGHRRNVIMRTLEILVLVQLVAVLVMLASYQSALRWRDLGWVDAGWAAGVGLVAVLLAVLTEGVVWRRLLVATLALVWSARLTRHVLMRVLSGTEDARYQALRAHWGEGVKRNALGLFLAESILITLFSVPILAAMHNPHPTLTLWDLAALLTWIGAVLGETIADQQLERFRRVPTNCVHTCREGLWRYSRHPNYFFEWLHWFAYPMLAMGAPHAAWAWLGPLLMLGFLFKVTGIPFAEKQSLARRGADYLDYQQTTSIFIPWFPRRQSTS